MNVREIILTRLKKDLLGPFDGNEEIIDYSTDGPDKEYFAGKLYPQNEKPDEDVIEEFIEEVSVKDITNAHHEESSKPKDRIFSCGLTFYMASKNQEVSLSLDYNYGRYFFNSEDETWKRKAIENSELPNIFSLRMSDNEGMIDELEDKENGLSLHYKTRLQSNGILAVSIFALNQNTVNDDDSFQSRQEKIFFQFGFTVKSISGNIVPIPSNLNPIAEDNINNFLYRNNKTYSVGHGCSSDWLLKDNFIEIKTEWFPEHFVPDMSPDGDKSLKDINFDAQNLASSSNKDILESLKNLVKKYKGWISTESAYEIPKDDNYKIFSEVLKKQSEIAKKHLKRMNKSIDILENNANAIEAFRLANRALHAQYLWSDIDLIWRPFQMGFLLVTLESTLVDNSTDRDEVDLLWFPTGGGKTEAYLFLSAILLFFRKLEKGSLNEKDGLAIISRYTMRALTNEQFKRMASTILACEFIRRKELKSQDVIPKEDASFSIGMWVGEAATPNKLAALNKGRNVQYNRERINVINECPCCNKNLQWFDESRPSDFRPQVKNIDKCELSKEIKSFPIYVIDEQIYDDPPSAIVGTVDKFVQVIRNPISARKIFAVDKNMRSLDLIIQDELHLISGPLGSISGLIEILIEEYASNGESTPKIIGSTATIQRAEEQIKSLYFKDSLQFPINISSIEDSFFSQTMTESPGRKYLGITSGSSTSTYMMQALCGILLQSLKDPQLEKFNENEIDPYTTIVTYFNTLRVLSGSKVTLQDDTSATIKAFAQKYNEEPFEYDIPEELTSANTQEELRNIMDRLAKDHSQEDSISILLASVMISVGLDISRLGLMIVDGQPKSIAEYIQATSRVGRGKIPGLVLTLFNNYKPRDKSYYETFQNWHHSLYRFVESTGVTPFSARARQKIFPALVVSLTLKKLNRTSENFSIKNSDKEFIENEVKPIILNKIQYLDPLELRDAENEIDEIIKRWINRGENIPYLLNDQDELASLLISAEANAAKKASDIEGELAFPSPNSAREVEPSVRIKAYKSLNSNLFT
jgi:superfamily II DNA or RNA helicase